MICIFFWYQACPHTGDDHHHLGPGRRSAAGAAEGHLELRLQHAYPVRCVMAKARGNLGVDGGTGHPNVLSSLSSFSCQVSSLNSRTKLKKIPSFERAGGVQGQRPLATPEKSSYLPRPTADVGQRKASSAMLLFSSVPFHRVRPGELQGELPIG